MIDTLTNLSSKNALEKQISISKFPILFLVDIKDFRLINLNHGDEGGDFTLCSFANSLKTFAQEHKMSAFRVENDEFALLADIPFDLDKIEKLIFDLVNLISSQKYNFNSEEITIQANIGICFDLKNSLKKASLALALAQKEDQPFISYSEFASKLLREKNDTASKEIETAVENGFITPYYQKVINLAGEEIYQEVLMRLSLKESIQPPKFFLEIARKRGFYINIVELLSKEVLSKNIKQAINFSFEDLNDEVLFDYLLKTYRDKNIIFELQGTSEAQTELVLSKIRQLKDANISICLDNISNPKILKLYDSSVVDFVKADGDLIRLLNISEESKATCRAILAECDRLKCKSIASRINSKTSLEEAQKLGFDYFQGFFFGKPTNHI